MNPFRDTIVSDPWRASAVDVPEIQADVFDECLRGIDHVRRLGHSAGILIHGAAGSGKTHLLSRLRGRLTLQAPTATDRDECLFVWVRLQASPRMIWRHVRRTLVEDWFRPVRGQRTQFERILFHCLAELRVAEGDLEPWYEFMREEKPVELDALLDRVADEHDLDRNTAIALKHLAFDRHRRDLRAWLGGDSLPEEVLARLGFSMTEGTDEEKEHEARRVLLMLCKLAGTGMPMLLSFDQVEALQTSPDDREGLYAFGQLVSTLHDEAPNLLIVSCVQSSFATELEDKSLGAAYDRMTSLGARSLATLTRSQVEKLIAARLALAATLHVLPAPRAALWPLDEAGLQRLRESNELTPRRLLATCADRFDELLAVPPGSATVQTKTPSIADFLDDEWTSRLAGALSVNVPERTADIVRHGFPLLVKLVAPEANLVRDEMLPDVPLIFEQASGRAGMSICTQRNMTSVAGQLRRLKSQLSEDRLKRLVIVRDSRVEFKQTAKAKQYLGELEERGATIIYPSVAALAALDALRALMSDAKSGDLDRNGEIIPPQTVEEWLRAHLTEELRQLTDLVLGNVSRTEAPACSDTSVLEALHTLLAERPVLTLVEAAQVVQRPIDDVTIIVRRHSDQFGIIGQPPTIVFRAVETIESSSA